MESRKDGWFRASKYAWLFMSSLFTIVILTASADSISSQTDSHGTRISFHHRHSFHRYHHRHHQTHNHHKCAPLSPPPPPPPSPSSPTPPLPPPSRRPPLPPSLPPSPSSTSPPPPPPSRRPPLPPSLPPPPSSPTPPPPPPSRRPPLPPSLPPPPSSPTPPPPPPSRRPPPPHLPPPPPPPPSRRPSPPPPIKAEESFDWCNITRLIPCASMGKQVLGGRKPAKDPCCPTIKDYLGVGNNNNSNNNNVDHDFDAFLCIFEAWYNPVFGNNREAARNVTCAAYDYCGVPPLPDLACQDYPLPKLG